MVELSEEVDPGDFSSGAARSICVVGGCFVAADLPVGVFSVGVALSIAAVGGCLRGFALEFEPCCVPAVALSLVAGAVGCVDVDGTC